MVVFFLSQSAGLMVGHLQDVGVAGVWMADVGELAGAEEGDWVGTGAEAGTGTEIGAEAGVETGADAGTGAGVGIGEGAADCWRGAWVGADVVVVAGAAGC